MGLFDELKCYYPLPGPGLPVFQTKDLACCQDKYMVKADGTLWHEEYEIEDQSDKTKEGFDRIIGCMTRVRQRWVEVKDFIGEVRFYGKMGELWIEYSSYFVDGKLKEIHRINAN